MANSVACDKFGFFNGIYAIEQSNWADFWAGGIPSCVCSSQGGALTDMGDELEVYAVSGGEGMKVRVKSGQAFVNGHHAWSTSEKVLDIASADGSNPRIDAVVLRVVYGNEGESEIDLAVVTGTASATPSAPTPTQNTGTVWELPLAEVLVGTGVSTITPDKVTDRRYIHVTSDNDIVSFSSATVAPQNELEYRNIYNLLTSLEINLPEHPCDNFITSVVFISDGTTFAGVTVKKGTTTISGTSDLHLKGDVLNLKGRAYTLVFWWDGMYYWCASASVA